MVALGLVKALVIVWGMALIKALVIAVLLAVIHRCVATAQAGTCLCNAGDVFREGVDLGLERALLGLLALRGLEHILTMLGCTLFPHLQALNVRIRCRLPENTLHLMGVSKGQLLFEAWRFVAAKMTPSAQHGPTLTGGGQVTQNSGEKSAETSRKTHFFGFCGRLMLSNTVCGHCWHWWLVPAGQYV